MGKKVLIYWIIGLMMAGFAFSQVDQTGSISGVVRTPEGDTLRGVIVLLRSPALDLPELEAITNASGLYGFPCLSPGTYELTFILKGLQQSVQKGIVVSAGGAVSLDMNLPLRAPEETIVVEGKVPERKYDGPGFTLQKRVSLDWQFHIFSTINSQPGHGANRILEKSVLGNFPVERLQQGKIPEIRLRLYRRGLFTLGLRSIL
jgi:hypothetical protein